MSEYFSNRKHLKKLHMISITDKLVDLLNKSEEPIIAIHQTKWDRLTLELNYDSNPTSWRLLRVVLRQNHSIHLEDGGPVGNSDLGDPDDYIYLIDLKRAKVIKDK